jgi:hypothetical protein
MLDFDLVREKKKTLAELASGLTVAELHCLTDEMIDTMFRQIESAADVDVVFVPQDSQADDPYAQDADQAALPWTLGHVIVHTTASAEEAAAQACELARGVPVQGRSRYEVPWETVSTVLQLRQRLEESRRMRHAFLNAWPDEPHLETTYTPDYPGARPRNALTRFIAGLAHDDSHLEQISKILQQAQANR